MISEIIVLVIAVLLVAILTAGGMAMRSVSRIWLRHWVEQRLRGSAVALAYLERPQRLIIAASAVIALLLVLSGELIAAGHAGSDQTMIIRLVVFAAAIVVFGQLLPRAEVVVVTTPQKLAQEVASRAASMARKTNMRLVGVIENMSGDVFGSGGGDDLADQLGVPLLGRVPLDPALREQGDVGEPLVAARPEEPTARVIAEIAEAIDARREPGSIVKALPLVG